MSATPPIEPPPPAPPAPSAGGTAVWRLAAAWLLPPAILLLAFWAGYQLGRRDAPPRGSQGLMRYDGPLPSRAEQGAL